LAPGDERAIRDSLARQAEIWHSLLFGLRTPESYLYALDRRLVVWLTWFLLFVVVVLPIALIGLLLAAVAATWLGGVVVPSLFEAVQDTLAQAETASWNDLLKLFSSLLAAVSALVVGIRLVLRRLRQLTERIRHELFAYFVARRTLIPWDRGLKKRTRQ
jgi:hypothetical protein